MREIVNFQLALDVTQPQEVMLPKYAQPLCLRILQNLPVCWALVNPEAELVPRHFLFVRTNFPLADDFEEHWLYVDTFQYVDANGTIMFHLFVDRFPLSPGLLAPYYVDTKVVTRPSTSSGLITTKEVDQS